jgi:hypothetical protein
MTNLNPSRLQIALSLLVGCLLATAGPVTAQTATSSFSVTTSGTIGSSTNTVSSASVGTTAPEAINCTGTVKLSATVVNDPVMPPQVVLSVDTRGLSCVGQTSKTTYLNSGQGNLTRPLVANDVVQMTFAIYPNTAGGYMKARTGLATANLSFNTTTGALTGASATIGNFQ